MTSVRKRPILQDGRLVDLGGSGPSAQDLVAVWRQRVRRKWLIRIALPSLIVAGCILVSVLALSPSLKQTVDGSRAEQLRHLVNEYGAFTTSVATVFLTIGLLAATWRYSRLTASMLEELRLARQYEAEPQVIVYVRPLLE